MKFLKTKKLLLLTLVTLLFGGCSEENIETKVESSVNSNQYVSSNLDLNEEINEDYYDDSLSITEENTNDDTSSNTTEENTQKVESETSSENNQNSKEEALPTSIPEDSIKVTIERVVDGDTVEIILPDGEKVSTRLLLIDTPETKHPTIPVQPYGPEASQFAESVLFKGDTAYFELDGNTKTDRYGRYLGYLWYEDNGTYKMYNEEIVKEGLARVGYIYSQTKHLTLLNKAQDVAKANKVNIWSVDGYVTNDGFDIDKIQNTSSNNQTSSSTNQPSNNNINDEVAITTDEIKDTTSNNSSEKIVYANGGASSSNIYHDTSDAHGMKDAIKMTEQEAIDQGYRACLKCY
ncbi:MAG: thermonuclease family protein [Peptostreptococcaceae bacterium]